MDIKKAQSVLITGASTGIGKATAITLDRSNYRVFAGVRKEEDADKLREAASNRLVPIQLDITRTDQIASALKQVKDRLGGYGLNGLVNNAGICVGGPIEALPLEILRRHIEINVIGQIAVTRSFLPLIRSCKGRIINVGSATGRFSLPFLGAYSASKFALVALTDALRRELRPWGIVVSIVEPGTVATPIWEKSFEVSYHIKSQIPDNINVLYENEGSSMAAIMKTGRKYAVTPEAVAVVILRALKTRRPKIRYGVGAGAWMALFGSHLPRRFTDWIFAMVLAKKLPTKTLGW